MPEEGVVPPRSTLWPEKSLAMLAHDRHEGGREGWQADLLGAVMVSTGRGRSLIYISVEKAKRESVVHHPMRHTVGAHDGDSF
jgi:hypothetical protein